MPRIRTDFEISGDLVIDPDVDDATLFKGNDFEITLLKSAPDDLGHMTIMVARVIGPATDLKSAETEHRAFLANKLDYLSLVTLQRYEIKTALRVIEWEPGPGKRRYLQFYRQDARYPPLPNLSDDLLLAAQHLATNAPPAFVTTALKYFRFALLEWSSTDQFIKLWHAIEIVAENLKDKETIPLACRKCSEPLVCTCGEHATRGTAARDAIANVFAQVGIRNPDSAIAVHLQTRNTLMHGGDAQSVKRRTGMELSLIVHDLALIVQAAIIRQLRPPEGEFVMMVDNDVENKYLVATAEMEFEHHGKDDYPAEAILPRAELSIQHTLKKKASD